MTMGEPRYVCSCDDDDDDDDDDDHSGPQNMNDWEGRAIPPFVVSNKYNVLSNHCCATDA